ncbi:MAG: bifunctional phosphopantothenoylcysteine decarboxylase/phosphopantothenate--cysteine ligase CoaBC [Proteobacteria bacterium]|nr:bifunctional phosphopantothenoylcysteine decarboxylase/phosphopantothenate--cysteine ligase CoaBC [Pseudomonadota bacterium]
MDPSPPKRVLLIVGGGIAAYKALELVRLFRRAGVGVRVVLTRAGAEFVTPLSLGALSEDRVFTELFSLTDEQEIGHIELSRQADLLVVAPASANLLAKAANGMADDLATTVLLATDKPVLMAPAMNVRMWLHPATVRNVDGLTGDGVRFVGPDEGAMACGEFGPGRMAEPQAIFTAAMSVLATGPVAAPPVLPLKGRRVLVTAGPTFEPIDPVRGLSNRSSGKQGYAIAEALAELGAEVTLISGPVDLPTPAAVRRVKVVTASQMLEACRAALPVDAAVMAAAVSDWRPERVADRKLKKEAGAPEIRLVRNPDILATLSQPGPERPQLVVGFAAETDHLEEHARDKLVRKGCNWIVANDVTRPGVLGGEENAVTLLTGEGEEAWPRATKVEVARRLAERIAAALAEGSEAGDVH